MIHLLRLTKLKMIDLLNRPVMLLMLLVLPILLGSIAGAANMRNVGKDIFLSVVDLDQTRSSAGVIADLQAKGWHIYPENYDAAQRRLLRNEVDGVLMIDKGFEEDLDDFDKSNLRYTEAEGSMVTTMVREVIVASVLPLFSQESMLRQLEELYAASGESMPADLPERFAERIEELSQGQAKIVIEYFGSLVLAPTLTFVVSDYSMEVFFLSIYAVLGTLSLSRAVLRQRLGSTAHGLRRDYLASLISLQILGELQILLYTYSMLLLMNRPIVLYDIFILSVFLFLILGVGQLLSLIEESLRLYLSLMLLLFSAVLGGCFFQLSSRLLLNYGQYSPHGWALSTLRGTRVAPVWAVLLIGLVLMAAGYLLQRRRVSQVIE
ncbi:MAG: hypothetical protein PHQ55_02620 [Eubacteriales bacterium]|nr:hypothetical protein [Eubacteriales bacterium]MDD3198538.1 hypothetical protein [Eubacteriales bacterium]MDD3503993.1 hypothetical protein [Eubacteriales bacterium]MDD4682047.1 hypothetical protein [Eubacteriales bacterium]